MAPKNPFDFSDFAGPESERTASPRLTGSPKAHAHPVPGSAAGDFDPFADQQATQRLGHGDAFGDTPGDAFGTPIRALTVTGPPVTLFAAAFVIALVGLIVGAVAILRGSTLLPAFAGWLLAGPGAIGALAWFSSVDTRRRLSSVYSAPAWLHSAYWIVLATCGVGIGLGAWQIALWAGRQ